MSLSCGSAVPLRGMLLIVARGLAFRPRLNSERLDESVPHRSLQRIMSLSYRGDKLLEYASPTDSHAATQCWRVLPYHACLISSWMLPLSVFGRTFTRSVCVLDCSCAGIFRFHMVAGCVSSTIVMLMRKGTRCPQISLSHAVWITRKSKVSTIRDITVNLRLEARKEQIDEFRNSEVVIFVDHFLATQPLEDDAFLLRASTNIPSLNLWNQPF